MSAETSATINRRSQSSQVRCPQCEQAIDAKSMNIAEGVALCPACGKLTRLSELNRGEPTARELLVHPPGSCSLDQIGQGMRVSVSLRSIPGAIFLGGFALIWNFGTISTAVSNITVMDHNTTFSLFSLLFSIPFIVIGIGLAVAALLGFFGKVFVVIDEAGCYAATGFEHVNWKRRFNMQQVRSIELVDSNWQVEGRSNKVIKIEADNVVKVAATATDDARLWMLTVLQYLLLPSESGAQQSLEQRWQLLQAAMQSA